MLKITSLKVTLGKLGSGIKPRAFCAALAQPLGKLMDVGDLVVETRSTGRRVQFLKSLNPSKLTSISCPQSGTSLLFP